jgi:hypothetical protein
MNQNRTSLNWLILVIVIAAGQALSYVASPDAWRSFAAILPGIVSMIAFWGPVIGLTAFLLAALALRLLGFKSFDELRRESVEENNPAPAIIFVGILISSILFLMVVIRP